MNTSASTYADDNWIPQAFAAQDTPAMAVKNKSTACHRF